MLAMLSERGARRHVIHWPASKPAPGHASMLTDPLHCPCTSPFPTPHTTPLATCHPTPPHPADLTIDKALSLGDRLVGLLQYHAVPGVVPPDQLGTEPSLPTLLGDSYRIGVEKDADGKVRGRWCLVKSCGVTCFTLWVGAGRHAGGWKCIRQAAAQPMQEACGTAARGARTGFAQQARAACARLHSSPFRSGACTELALSSHRLLHAMRCR